MKQLFVRLFIICMSATLLVLILIAYLEQEVYLEQAKSYYLEQSQIVRNSIKRELDNDLSSEVEVLAWWSSQLGVKIAIAKPSISHSEITQYSITDSGEYVRLEVPFTQQNHLIFNYAQEASADYLTMIYASYLLIFILVALLVFLISRVSYRYLEGMSQAIERIVGGDYGKQIPRSRLKPLNKLLSLTNQLAEQLMLQKQQQIILNGAIGHELRSPLMRLRLALDMGRKGDYGEPDIYLREMDEDLSELEELTTELIWIARAQYDSTPQELQSLDISQLVLECTRGYSLVNLTAEPDIYISAQPLLIERAIRNLLDNAQKFAVERINVDLSSDQTTITLIVEDDGKGLSESNFEKVFIPFYQIDKSRNKHQGVGLGLAITKLAIELNGGDISVTNGLLGGARFEMTWPRAGRYTDA